MAAVVLFDLGVNAPASLGLVGKLPAFVLGECCAVGIGRCTKAKVRKLASCVPKLFLLNSFE